MNKTIIININGTVFHIEEDAYEVLKNYMTNVKRHFADVEDSFEITTDIENRIAEMFTEILGNEAKQVIVAADVDKIIAQMGTVEDFGTQGDEPQTRYQSQQAFTDNRKLFRDSDDHLLGGVCAGIANYFDVSTVWIRLAFLIGFLIWGTGVLAYIILWIVVPRAITRADKMAMKGEKLDLQGFRKNYEEETKSGAANDAAHGRPMVYKSRDFVGDLFQHFGAFLSNTGRVILKIIGVFILLTCFGFLIATIVGFICLLVYGNSTYHVFPFSMFNYGYSNILYIGAFLLAFLPILGIALLTIRVIFNGSAIGRSTAYTMLIVWIGALSVVIYYSAKIAGDFRESASISQNIDIKPIGSGVYHLKLNDVRYFSKEDSLEMDINSKFKGRVILDNDRHNDDDMMGRRVSINVERVDGKQMVLVESFSAKGPTERDAYKNAQNATYNFTQQDSILTFDRRLQLPKRSLWRDQEVELTLKVPYGVQLIVDEDLSHFFRNSFDFDNCRELNKTPEANRASFIMLNDGLQCKVDTQVLAQPAIAQPVKH